MSDTSVASGYISTVVYIAEGMLDVMWHPG